MTTQYGKFLDSDTIIRPKKHLKLPNLIAFNFDKNIELMKSQGYCELREDEKPEYDETTTYLKPQYELTDEAILVHWVEEEVQEEGAE